MKSIFNGLFLASAAAAQIVNGLSSVPATTGASSPAQPAATPTTSTAAASSAPAQPNSGAAAQYTVPPAPGQDFYQYMPYNNMTSGGYKQLQCGYGYQKQADGSCVPFSWVSF